jgi:hypothetical protein
MTIHGGGSGAYKSSLRRFFLAHPGRLECQLGERHLTAASGPAGVDARRYPGVIVALRLHFARGKNRIPGHVEGMKAVFRGASCALCIRAGISNGRRRSAIALQARLDILHLDAARRTSWIAR